MKSLSIYFFYFYSRIFPIKARKAGLKAQKFGNRNSGFAILKVNNKISTLYAYEDGTASKFRNVDTKSSDAGRLLKKHNTAIKFIDIQ